MYWMLHVSNLKGTQMYKSTFKQSHIQNFSSKNVHYVYVKAWGRKVLNTHTVSMTDGQTDGWRLGQRPGQTSPYHKTSHLKHYKRYIPYPADPSLPTAGWNFYQENWIQYMVSPDKMKFNMVYHLKKHNSALHCPCRENRFTQSNLSSSAWEIPKNFFPVFFVSHKLFKCCIHTLFCKMCHMFERRYNA